MWSDSKNFLGGSAPEPPYEIDKVCGVYKHLFKAGSGIYVEQ